MQLEFVIFYQLAKEIQEKGGIDWGAGQNMEQMLLLSVLDTTQQALVAKEKRREEEKAEWIGEKDALERERTQLRDENADQRIGMALMEERRIRLDDWKERYKLAYEQQSAEMKEMVKKYSALRRNQSKIQTNFDLAQNALAKEQKESAILKRENKRLRVEVNDARRAKRRRADAVVCIDVDE